MSGTGTGGAGAGRAPAGSLQPGDRGGGLELAAFAAVWDPRELNWVAGRAVSAELLVLQMGRSLCKCLLMAEPAAWVCALTHPSGFQALLSFCLFVFCAYVHNTQCR